jgi:glutamate-1-semialdehyde 2,1-aminomutase
MSTISSLLEQEKQTFMERTTGSLAQLRRMAVTLPLGVASAYQAQPPYPLVYDRAAAQFAWDIDGNKYLDLHAGFGANVFGHGHPVIVSALNEQAQRGSHYAHPTKALGDYSAIVCDRFGLQQMRMCNSGSEATMEALRLARVFTGRSKIVRMEGAYHGHHDLVLMSMKPDPAQVGDLPRPGVQPATEGLSESLMKEVVPLAFNDSETLWQVLQEEQIAAVIIEPVMCNLGMIEPQQGYLEEVRAACTATGTVLIWDQVKTGATLSWNGANTLYPDALPDLHCLGKTVGGGLPVGVYGGRRDIMSLISQGRADGYGTFNGNALTVAAGTAALQILDQASYQQLEDWNQQLQTALSAIVEEYDLPAYVAGYGAKLGIFWAKQMPANYREYLSGVNEPLAQLSWLWLANRGVLGAPGSDEQWTLCTVLDYEQDSQQLLSALTSLAAALRA